LEELIVQARVRDCEEFLRDLIAVICFYRQASLADHQERPAAVAEALRLILKQEVQTLANDERKMRPWLLKALDASGVPPPKTNTRLWLDNLLPEKALYPKR
jgi:hypothetical protein